MQRVAVQDGAAVVRAIAAGLDKQLAEGKRVLWLLSGGSNIAIELQVLQQLSAASPQNLTISLLDERYVPLDSPDSNWHQLELGGLSGEKARLVPVLHGKALSETVQDFALVLQEELQKATVVVGQFGIGSDGHTAGILPHSPAVHEAQALLAGYEGPDFARITITPAVIKRIDLAIVVALGRAKAAVVHALASPVIADEQPAQLLKQAKELIIYTDQNGSGI